MSDLTKEFTSKIATENDIIKSQINKDCAEKALMQREQIAKQLVDKCNNMKTV